MGDLAAVRVSPYLEADRGRIVEGLKQAFDFAPETPGRRNPDERNATGRAKHYRAIHCQVLLKTEDLKDLNSNLAGTSCEIQVCSMLAHVWNEIEHDIGYKPHGPLSEYELDCLEALGELAKAGDAVIKTLLEANRERVFASETQFGNRFDFMTRMQKDFPQATEFPLHAAQLFDVLLEFGLDSPVKIRDALLQGTDYVERAIGLATRLQAYIGELRDGVVGIDLKSSDVLAVLFLEKNSAEFLRRHPAGRGMGRPMRLVSLAKRFEDMNAAGPGGAR
jgi:hypothetical protein